MVNGRHLDSGPFQGPKATLNDHEPFIAMGGILEGNGIVIGLDHPLAVVGGGFPDRPAVDSDTTAL